MFPQVDMCLAALCMVDEWSPMSVKGEEHCLISMTYLKISVCDENCE